MPTGDTTGREYAERLRRAAWKRALGAQLVYAFNVRRLNPGRTLDIGCGVGRNLRHLAPRAVGIDHNAHAVAMARSSGHEAFTPEEFQTSRFNTPRRFDNFLLAHVAEHMTLPQAVALLNGYLDLLRPGGRVTIITPQERGFRADATHVEFMDFVALRRIVETCGLVVVKEYSFPFPLRFGRWFTHNEYVSVSLKPDR